MLMMVKACKTRLFSNCLSKHGAILIILTLLALYFVLYMNFWQNEVQPMQTFSTKSNTMHSFCSLRPQSPEDHLETQLLLDSIVWPYTPQLSVPVSLEQSSSAANSKFTILPGTGRGQWHVGDQLEVMVNVYDFQGHPKKFGGDFLLARLHNSTLGAGVAGQVVDHLNGSYSAVFSLLWEGSGQVEVTLVHPSEAIAVLHSLTSQQPDRIYFQSLFRSGSVSETTICNVCLSPTQALCNYTDLRTGEPWFCYKPTNLSCDARINHSKGGFKKNLMDWEEALFQSGVNMKASIQSSGSSSITVLPKKTGQPGMKDSSVSSRPSPSGYYYRGVWQALGGTTVVQFNSSSAISQCLREKVVHMFGDSTIRQWFEHLVAAVPDLKNFNLQTSKQAGPFMALDYINNIMVTYHCHGPPIRFIDVPVSDLRYIANELDALKGGKNTIVVLGIWSHFSTFPIEVYIRRLQSIRKAVERLLDRAPDTVVIIRSANLKKLTLFETLTNSDWYSLQRDKALRAVFEGINVHLVDAWEMSLAHYLPHSLHPQPSIIGNMINVLLSYSCPKNKG